jgi:hypothetical protein
MKSHVFACLRVLFLGEWAKEGGIMGRRPSPLITKMQCNAVQYGSGLANTCKKKAQKIIILIPPSF